MKVRVSFSAYESDDFGEGDSFNYSWNGAVDDSRTSRMLDELRNFIYEYVNEEGDYEPFDIGGWLDSLDTELAEYATEKEQPLAAGE